jgi:2-amino-4-hydroxy-6-hydroxymethyldihydropteridine diphosphokinase
MSPAVRAYVGLGANIGDARRTMQAGVAALWALPGARLSGVSRLYVTTPVGVADQPDFHNAVASLEVQAGPDPATGALALLSALKGIERAFGRQDRGRWRPRELDLDLLVFGRHRLHLDRPEAARSMDPARIDSQWLDVPHASMRDRLFVLAPLADLAAGLVPPGWRETVETARHRRVAVEGVEAARPVGIWDGAARCWR